MVDLLTNKGLTPKYKFANNLSLNIYIYIYIYPLKIDITCGMFPLGRAGRISLEERFGVRVTSSSVIGQ